MSEDLQAVVARLETLERRMRRLRLISILAVVMSFTALSANALYNALCRVTNKYPSIAVREVVLIDEEGRRRGYLGLERSDLTEQAEEPILAMVAENGRPMVMLSAGDEGGALMLNGTDALAGADLSVTDFGSGLYLRGGTDKPTLIVSSHNDGAMFSLTDGKLAPRWHFVLKEDETKFSVNDKDGKRVWSAP